ncbi:hypothetical protein Acid345_4383 [Candidatus Koribacter versatilis Ellin345]|uniref:Uncharacterized protein n=1 Tax=Koribacter versatilis (strain Ellin345) TaxID=204669 RepID=Q1IIB7_KORVE|nr:hypothetical protein Acid345_4383 [Candidatus Koribacter versatilis Ellin345]
MALMTISCACSRSGFERENAIARSHNPVGVELHIQTKNHKREFSAGEKLQFEEFYTSKYPGQWHIEVLEGVNGPANTDVVYIFDGKRSWTSSVNQSSIACCMTRHVWLGLEPTRVPYNAHPEDIFGGNPEYREFAVPDTPGKYEIYLTSDRLYSRDEKTETYSGKGTRMTSDIMSIRVR